jgi:putative phosphoesterase
MILGIISDTHEDRMNAIPHIIKEFKRRKVKLIIHCGDIIPEHLNAKLFGNIPMICALTEGQTGKAFQEAPEHWTFTKTGDRVKNLNEHTKIYVGHKRFFELLRKTESDFSETLEIITRDHDCVRWLFGGHTHRQVFMQNNLINCLNPGAVEGSFWGYEFAVVDTETNETTFSRILPREPAKKTSKIAVISDSRNISELNPDFWAKLAEELKKRNIKEIIHCGNLATADIGKKELRRFKIHYNLRKDQRNPKMVPGNWKFIEPSYPIVKIDGYRFCVQHDLGKSLLYESEMGMLGISLKLVMQYPAIEFVLFGLTHEAFLEENEQVQILNPGDVVKDQNYAVIEFPRNEITFSSIPQEPLPPINTLTE